jgi:hypothetical protein
VNFPYFKLNVAWFSMAEELEAGGGKAPPIGLIHTAWGGSMIEQVSFHGSTLWPLLGIFSKSGVVEG